VLPEPILECGLMTAEVEPKPLDTLLPTRLGRIDWTDELLNWITKYEVIVVALTLVSAAVPCGDAPMR
jgi:hypothetical protein